MEKEYKRVGRPRFYWLNTIMGKAFKLIRKKEGKVKKEFKIKKKKHRERIEKAALNREYPFDKKKNRNKMKRKKKKKPRGAIPQPNCRNQKSHSQEHDYEQDEDDRRWEQEKEFWRNFFEQAQNENKQNKHSQHNESWQRRHNNTDGAGNSRQPYNEADRRKKQLLLNLKPSFTKLDMQPILNIKEAQRQFKRLALVHHPDKGGSADNFRSIKAALDKIVASIEDYRKRFDNITN